MNILQNFIVYIFLFLVELMCLSYAHRKNILQVKDRIYAFAVVIFSLGIPILSLMTIETGNEIRGVMFLRIGLFVFFLLALAASFLFLKRNKGKKQIYALFFALGVTKVLFSYFFAEIYGTIAQYGYLVLIFILAAIYLKEKKQHQKIEVDVRLLLYFLSFLLSVYDVLYIEEPHEINGFLVEAFILLLLFLSYVFDTFFKMIDRERLFAEERELRYKELLDASEKINSMAYFDQMTGLHNKVALKHFMLRLVEEEGFVASLLIMDIDNFKDINNSYGISEGDEVLKHFGNCLKDLSESQDFVYRFSGDQFGILHIGDLNEAVSFAENLMECLHFGNWYFSKYHMSISIGITELKREKDYEQIYKESELALAEAKRRGKKRFCVFSEEMMQKYDKDHHLERLLQNRIEKQEFELYCQPKVDLQTGEICGGELLLRMRDEEGLFISPQILIPIAEKAGLIEELDKMVLERASGIIKEWEMQGIQLPMSVNVSSKEFVRADFVPFVEHCLEKYQIDPRNLVIEITENSLIENMEAGSNIASMLKERGVKIALDDFGTGYSSLSYLVNLPVDEVKIDKSVTWNLETNHKSIVFLKKLSEFLAELDIDFVVEGVETKEQLSLISRCGKGTYQGFFSYEPMEIVKLTEMLKKVS